MQRIENLTFLRFVAASVVVVYHYGLNEPFARSLTGFFSSGPMMVSFFFVLSGFVMVTAHYHKNLPLETYFRARLTRILPTYWAALLLSFVLRSLNGQPAEWTAFGLSALTLQSWLPPYPFSVNGPGWSLSVEMFFYAVFPFLLPALQQRILRARHFLLAALAVWALTEVILIGLFNSSFYRGYPSISNDLLFFFPLTHFPTFLLGMAGGYLFVEQKNSPLPARWLNGLTVILALLIAFSLHYRAYIAAAINHNIPFDAGFFAPLFLLLVLCAAWLPAGWLSARPLALLGEASYAVYIFQYPLRLLFDRFFASVIPVPLYFWTYFVFLVGFCLVFYGFVEKPLKTWLGRNR